MIGLSQLGTHNFNPKPPILNPESPNLRDTQKQQLGVF